MKKRAQQILGFIIAGGLCYAAFIGPLHANPQGGLVVGGSATIQADASSLIVTQNTDKAIINWQQFNIASGEKTIFLQPNSNSLILNRVVGGDPSQILGQISANGRVVLVNPAGIYMGNTARINVNSLIATTANISDANFMAGNLQFSQDPALAKSIINNGEIHAAAEGLVALVAPAVANNGIIQANLGKVALAAGNAFTVDLYGDQLVNFAVNSQVTKAATDQNGAAMTSAVSNKGKIIADGGKVLMTANVAQHVVQNVINLEGVAQAHSVSSRNGEIILSGGDKGVVRVAGELDVSGKAAAQKGGTIKVLGQNVKLEGAKLNASGDIGGGKILVGGNYQGGGTEQRAKTTSVDANSQLEASAITEGNGGQVVVWSDQHTQYAGHIAAKGGALSGNGGMAEVSGKEFLDFLGGVDLTAANGSMGELLLDPADLEISNAANSNLIDSNNPYTGGTSGTSYLNVGVLQTALNTANVVVQTAASGAGTGNITVVNDISWASNSSLTLKAYGNIYLNANISNTIIGGNSAINLIAGTSGSGTSTTGTILGNGDITNAGRQVNFYYNPSSYLTASYTNDVNTFTTNNIAAGTLTAYMLVNDVNKLQEMNTNLSGNYALSKNIEASAASALNGGTGFAPVGTLATPFTGKFDGLGFDINALTINKPTANYVGLFGYVNSTTPGMSTISNVGLTNVNMTAKGNVGALIGMNQGAYINNAFSTGLITTVNGDANQGGLIGYNQGGTISNSYSSVNLSTGNVPTIIGQVGGLVGENHGAITNSYATGNIDASQGGYLIGGLVGYAGFYNVAGDSPITNSYSTGNIIGGTERIGGFIGEASSIPIQNSYSTGSVQATSNATRVGGFIGLNGADISNSYSTGAVTVMSSGGNFIGGFVGFNGSSSSINSSYSTGNVSALNGSTIGGFAGLNIFGATINNAFSTGNVMVDAGDNIGGFVGRSSDNAITSNSYSTGIVSAFGFNVGGFAGATVSGASVVNSYWNLETSGKSTSGGGGLGRSTAQMMNQSNYTGLDFTNTWGIIENSSLPYLRTFHSSTGTPQVVSGKAYTDITAGANVGGNVSIGLAQGGIQVGATSTGANGFYYFLLPGGTIAAQAPILTYLNSGSLLGNSLALFANSGTSAITNHSIYGNAVTARNYSSANLSSSHLGTAIAGSPGFASRLLYGMSGNDINLTGSGVTFQTADNTGGAAVAGSGANFTLLGNLSSSGNINFNGGLELGGTGIQTISTASGNINLASITSGSGKDLALNADNITLAQVGFSSTPLNSLAATAATSLTLNGEINALTLSGSTPLININSTAVDVGNAINGFADSGATVNLLSGNYAQDVVINEAINLIGSGSVEFNSLTDTADLILEGTFTTTGDINLNGAVSLSADTSLTSGGAINFGDTLDLNHNLILSSNTLSLGPVNDVSGLNTLDTNATDLTLNGALNAVINADVSTLNINSTAIDINNAINDFVSIGATINLADGIYNQNVLINEAVNLVSLGTAHLTSLSNTTDMGLSGNFSADTFNIDAPMTLLGTTALTATAGNININNLIDGYQALTLTTSGLDATVINAAIGSITPLAALTINGNIIMNTGAAVNTVGSQLYNGALTLGGNVNLYSSNGNLTFNSTIQGPYDLTLGAPNGNITFNGAVGSLANRLGNLWITAANNVTALDALNVTSFIQSSGSGTTSFAGTGVNAAQNVLINTNAINGSITANNAAVLIGRNGINAQIDVGALTVGGLAGGTLTGKVANFEGAQAAFISRLATESQGIFNVNGVSLNLYNPEIDIRKLFGSYTDPTNDETGTDYPAIMDVETTQDVNAETKIQVEGDATLQLAAKALCQ